MSRLLSPKLKALRGMRDIFGDECACWQYLESEIIDTLAQYGYQQIRLPIIEKTALFTHAIGEDTDIVGKEMYSFLDRNEESVTLRPEGTASCVRAGIEHGLFYNQTQRFWYAGSMFRYERPQRGRQRQFHQIGVEAFGFPSPSMEAEQLLLCHRLWRRLGLENLTLHLNSLGSINARLKYRQALFDYFSDHAQNLDEDSQLRLHKNPLRILDSKNIQMQSLIQQAPSIQEYLDPESASDFTQIQDILTGHQINYKIDPCLVRGLDYYNKTVFEWISPELGAQSAVCSGGRYDTLVERHGGTATQAVGFAIGLERLYDLYSSVSTYESPSPHIYVVVDDQVAFSKGLKIVESLRDQLQGLRLIMHIGGGKLKTQLKKADRSQALLVLILGTHVLQNAKVIMKFMRDTQPKQIEVDLNDLASSVERELGKYDIKLERY